MSELDIILYLEMKFYTCEYWEEMLSLTINTFFGAFGISEDLYFVRSPYV